MPIDPNQFQTGGALQGAVAASLVREREVASELQVGDEVGNFRVLRELGRGGMAVVYLAERSDGEYEQRIALKWMQAGQNDAAGEALFRRERQALADLTHPHIARLLDGGRGAQGQPWFAMEYIDGQPLDAHCIATGLPLRQRLERFLEVCSAVAFAHAHGMLHRDIKPSNVLVDGEGGAKLLDFGIAQLLGDDDVLATRAFTPGFASPEQVAGEPLTAASDVYQLGRLLAAVLSRDATERDTVACNEATRVQAIAPDGTPVASTPANLPDDLAAILATACSIAPSRRYATVDALAADVRAFLDHRPVAARPRTATYLVTRYTQRHPVAVTASAAALALMLAASTVFVVRLRAERDAADHQAKVATTVLDFMRQDLLAAADPSSGSGQELSVRAALDLASASVGVRFADLPVEQAAVRNTLAGLYHDLGRLDDAEREVRHAVTLAAGQAEANADLHRSARTNLADVLISRNQMDEADTLLAALHAEYTRDAAPDVHRLLSIANLRGNILHDRGEYEHARQVHQDVLDRARKHLGESHPLALNTASRLAIDLQMQGRHDEALPLLRQVEQRRRETLGERHVLTLKAAHDLAVLLRHRGELDAAMALLEPTLTARREVLGAAHPETLITANETATVLQGLKRHDEAEALFREVLEQRLRTLGEGHHFTRNSMSNLGLLYTVQGKVDQAAPLYERALALEVAQVGENHPDTISLIHNIAGLYRKQGRFDDALAQHERAIRAAEASPDLGADAWQTALFRVGRAKTLHVSGRNEEADAEMTHGIAILERVLGPEHPRSVQAREMRQAMRE